MTHEDRCGRAAGTPVEVGNPESLICFKARFADELDPAAARVGLAIFSSAPAAIHFTLAHDIELDAAALAEKIDTIVAAVRGTLSYTFVDGGSARTLDAIALAAGDVSRRSTSILIPFPLTYVQYQDPSFAGVLYVDADRLPVAPEIRGDSFVPADSYLVNKATAGYFSFILDEWLCR